MKICPNCGAQNKDNDRFCGECGTKLPDAPVEEDAQKEAVSEEPAVVEEKKEEKPEEKPEKELDIMPLKGTIGEDESAEAKKEKEQAEAEKKKAEEAAKADEAAKPAQQKSEEKKPLTPEEVREKKKAEKKEAKEKAKAQMKEDVRKLPRPYHPIGVWHYFLLELLYLVVPFIISGLLLYYCGKNSSNLVYDLILLSGPVLELIFLVIGAFVSKNVNVRNFTRSYFLVMILLIIAGLVLMLTKAGVSIQSWYSFRPLFH